MEEHSRNRGLLDGMEMPIPTWVDACVAVLTGVRVLSQTPPHSLLAEHARLSVCCCWEVPMEQHHMQLPASVQVQLSPVHSGSPWVSPEGQPAADALV